MPRNPTMSDVRTVSQDKAREWQDGSIPRHGEGKRGSQCYTVNQGECMLWPYGPAYWSYSTCIAVVDLEMKLIVLNTTKYSTTTNRFAWMLRSALPAQYPDFQVLTVAPDTFNVTPDELVDLATGSIAEIPGDSPESILGDDDISMRRVYVNPWSGLVWRKHNRSTLI